MAAHRLEPHDDEVVINITFEWIKQTTLSFIDFFLYYCHLNCSYILKLL